MKNLPSPRPGGGAPIADMVFASALKVFTTFSSRHFNGALEDAVEKGFVSQKKIHSVSVCAFLEGDLMPPVLQKLIIPSSLPLWAIETDGLCP